MKFTPLYYITITTHNISNNSYHNIENLLYTVNIYPTMFYILANFVTYIILPVYKIFDILKSILTNYFYYFYYVKINNSHKFIVTTVKIYLYYEIHIHTCITCPRKIE